MEWFLLLSVLSLLCLKTQGWLFKKKAFKVCYDEYGCFSAGSPYTNTQGILPRAPSRMGTKFLITTRHGNGYKELDLEDQDAKTFCKPYKKKKLTKLIVHGYLHSVEKPWVKDMVKALLINEQPQYNPPTTPTGRVYPDDYNIILVDWRVGADEIFYMQSAANIRVVGAQIAAMLKRLQGSCGLDLYDVHIIGHSLGAHAAGYAGENLSGIGRITGLDPAGPFFEATDPKVRLDRGDALFVDVIHTDGEHLFNLGFGMKMSIGDVDFYPNGGMDQPGCPSTFSAQLQLIFKGNFEVVNNFGCSHLRALEFFTESINSECTFKAYPCPNVKRRTEKLCMSCKGGCAIMGFHSKPSTSPGKYVLQTGSKMPYCKTDENISD